MVFVTSYPYALLSMATNSIKNTSTYSSPKSEIRLLITGEKEKKLCALLKTGML